mgnify:CR=1 FL=1
MTRDPGSSPAITVGRSVPTNDADTLAGAFEAATDDPELSPALAALYIDGFVRTTIDDYLRATDFEHLPADVVQRYYEKTAPVVSEAGC